MVVGYFVGTVTQTGGSNPAQNVWARITAGLRTSSTSFRLSKDGRTNISRIYRLKMTTWSGLLLRSIMAHQPACSTSQQAHTLLPFLLSLNNVKRNARLSGQLKQYR